MPQAYHTLILLLCIFHGVLYSRIYGKNPADGSEIRAVLSAEPELIRSAGYTYPVRLLKKGVQGTVLLDIYINEQGAVDEVEIVGKTHPVLDSIARRAALQFLFSPAKEQGEPVPVVIRFQYVFDLAQILRDIRYTPNFSGRVIDAETEMPFRNFPVVCDFFDTTSDTALGIPFDSYIRLISSVPDQQYFEGNLITRTDSLGYFQFCFLPVCSLKVRIQPPFHKTFIAYETIKKGMNTKAEYKLSAIPNIHTESEYEIVVYGKKSTREIVGVHETELRYGLVDDINKVLFVRNAGNHIPERGSAILIHGGGIYDNNYEVCHIPVFPPSHFTNYPTLDLSGILVGTIDDVSILSSRLGGRYANAPGCVVLMNPGIYRPAKLKYLKRRELVVNMSTRKIDFSLSTPLRKEKDYYQLSCVVANERFLESWGGVYGFGNGQGSQYGRGAPACYGDLNITGISKFDQIDIHSFLWFAWDVYKDSEKYAFPWGAGSISFESKTNQVLHRAVIGGSSQRYYEGKKTGTISPLKTVKRENATVLLESESIPLGPFYFECKERIEYLQWFGTIENRSGDTTAGSEPPGGRGNEVHLQSRAGIQYKSDKISFGVDGLLGTITRYKKYYADPGLWCLIPYENGSTLFNVGIVSSFPDIRGIPDESYRGVVNKTYMATSSLERSFFRQTTTISLEPYIRWRDKCPRFANLYPVWVDSLATPLYSGGINYRISVVREKKFDINIAGMVGKSYRLNNHIRMPYEWDIPWSIKSYFNFHFFDDWMHFSLNSIISAGIPYRDLNDNYKLKRAGVYIRPDFQYEYHSQNLQHRYFTRYDLYVGVQNFLNFKNYVEPYWESNMQMQWIRLTPFMIYLGGRFAFRL